MAVSTPCVQLCVLDHEGRTCLGCGRTITEIGVWGALPESERLTIIADLPRRLAATPSADEARSPSTIDAADQPA